MFHFQDLWTLFITLPLLALGIFWHWRKRNVATLPVRVSNTTSVQKVKSWRETLMDKSPLSVYVGLGLCCIALARPQKPLKQEKVDADVVEIILTMDISSSMLALDFDPDRLEASKKVAADFIDRREFDRIGLVIFSGESFMQCPLTTDHKILKEFLASIKTGILEDGTAIGMGLATAVNHLKESKVKSKVVILLTDGVNNAGYVQPLTAANLAKEMGVRVYTIGVGTRGEAQTPIGRRGDGRYVYGYSQVEIDEDLLAQIADGTGGKYFRATDLPSLEKIYQEIDRLERTRVDVTVVKRYTEQFSVFLIPAVLLLLAFFFVRMAKYS